MMKTIMKKTAIAVITAAAILLVGCGLTVAEKVYDAGEYRLEKAELNGTEIAVNELYPEGATILLCSDGTGTIVLNDEESGISWKEEGETFSMLINELEASGPARTDENEEIVLTMGNTGFVFHFGEGETVQALAEETGKQEQTVSQQKWCGDWSGRMWFENPTGVWSDYVYRSFELGGNVALDAEGNGTVELFAPYYAEAVPFLKLNFYADSFGCHSLGGFLMGYELKEGECQLSEARGMESELRNYLIMAVPGDYGHLMPEYVQPEDIETDILRISGSCMGEEGGFDYTMELTRNNG